MLPMPSISEGGESSLWGKDAGLLPISPLCALLNIKTV